tara:strand:+ start:721 stop:894 length:174 start_codon:yes stop_codon:yes gene_type:complete
VKVGDLVTKHRGDWDVGKIGCVIEIITNGAGTELVKVMVDGEIKPWSKKLVKVINGK